MQRFWSVRYECVGTDSCDSGERARPAAIGSRGSSLHPLSPFSVLVPSGTLPGAARLPPHPASLFDVWCLGFGVTCLVCLVGCALVWFGGDVLAVPVPVTSHPPPLSVAVVQIEVNGASSLSPSLPLVCSSRFYVSRVVTVLPTEMTIGVVLYTYLSFVYLNTCLGCLAVSTIATGTFRLTVQLYSCSCRQHVPVLKY